MSLAAHPRQPSYDVVIVGGAMLGASVAWFLSQMPEFDGSVLVVERDPTYRWASTSHTNSCIRQQFSREINIQISQFGAQYIKSFQDQIDHPDAPAIPLHSFGYLYLADTPAFDAALRASQKVQARLGAGTRYLSTADIAAAFPFYHLGDVLSGTHNPVDEGYFDGNTMFQWWQRQARAAGVETIANDVVGVERRAGRIRGVKLADGSVVACGTLVNCAGPRAAQIAAFAGVALPVEPRKRFTFIFDAQTPLDQELPLTIDPTGVHMRSDGAYYMAGCAPESDHPVAYDDFTMDHSLWETKVWPIIAHRIPQFQALKLVHSWVGHYAYNTLDQNAIVGPHPEVENFLFANGFTGHGLQQSPAMGRGLAEWITHGAYQTLDLSPLHYNRIAAGEPFEERAVI